MTLTVDIQRVADKDLSVKRITKKRRKRKGKKDSELILDTYLTSALEGEFRIRYAFLEAKVLHDTRCPILDMH